MFLLWVFVGKAKGKCKYKIYYISSQVGLAPRQEGAGCTTQPQQRVQLERKQHPTVHAKWKEMVQGDTVQQEGFSSTNTPCFRSKCLPTFLQMDCFLLDWLPF